MAIQLTFNKTGFAQATPVALTTEKVENTVTCVGHAIIEDYASEVQKGALAQQRFAPIEQGSIRAEAAKTVFAQVQAKAPASCRPLTEKLAQHLERLLASDETKAATLCDQIIAQMIELLAADKFDLQLQKLVGEIDQAMVGMNAEAESRLREQKEIELRELEDNYRFRLGDLKDLTFPSEKECLDRIAQIEKELAALEIEASDYTYRAAPRSHQELKNKIQELLLKNHPLTPQLSNFFRAYLEYLPLVEQYIEYQNSSYSFGGLTSGYFLKRKLASAEAELLKLSNPIFRPSQPHKMNKEQYYDAMKFLFLFDELGRSVLEDMTMKHLPKGRPEGVEDYHILAAIRELVKEDAPVEQASRILMQKISQDMQTKPKLQEDLKLYTDSLAIVRAQKQLKDENTTYPFPVKNPLVQHLVERDAHLAALRGQQPKMPPAGQHIDLEKISKFVSACLKIFPQAQTV